MAQFQVKRKTKDKISDTRNDSVNNSETNDSENVGLTVPLIPNESMQQIFRQRKPKIKIPDKKYFQPPLESYIKKSWLTILGAIKVSHDLILASFRLLSPFCDKM